MDIEEVNRTQPEAVVKHQLLPSETADGLSRATALDIVTRANLPEQARDQAADLLVSLFDAMIAEDATLLEINPLILTTEGRVLALDSKVSLDNNAAFRHGDYAEWDVEGIEERDDAGAARPRRPASSTSSSTATSGCWATAPVWSWRRWTSSRRPAATPRTSSTSVVAPRPRPWPSRCRWSCPTTASRASWSTSSAASPSATRSPRACSARWTSSATSTRSWSCASTAPTPRRAAASSTEADHPNVIAAATMGEAAEKAVELAQQA